jgi:drug/metabolite transporter (DMT)-like permease
MQYAYPLLAIFIWAGNTVITKMSAGAIFPAEIGFYRWLLAGLLFTPFMLKPVLNHWPKIRPNLGKIFVLGVLGMAVYQSLAYFAASLTSATNMGIILSLMPLMSLAMAIISLGQRLTIGALVGAVMSFAGVLVVVSSGSLGALLEHVEEMAAETAAAGAPVLAGTGGRRGAVSVVSRLGKSRPDPAQRTPGAVRLPAGFYGRAAGLDASRGAPGTKPDHAVFQSAAADHRADCSSGAA